jgi:hypothetical protein
MEPTNQGEVPKLSQVIQIDEGKIQEHLGEVVRSTVEETLNAMLDAEADRLCRAEQYERTEARKDTRAGSYQRHLQTKAGEVRLKVPKLRNLPFETAINSLYGGDSRDMAKLRRRYEMDDVMCGVLWPMLIGLGVAEECVSALLDPHWTGVNRYHGKPFGRKCVLSARRTRIPL